MFRRLISVNVGVYSRNFASSAKRHRVPNRFPEHLQHLMTSRSRHERMDSITKEILESRHRHLERCMEINLEENVDYMKLFRYLKKTDFKSKFMKTVIVNQSFVYSYV